MPVLHVRVHYYDENRNLVSLYGGNPITIRINNNNHNHIIQQLRNTLSMEYNNLFARQAMVTNLMLNSQNGSCDIYFN